MIAAPCVSHGFCPKCNGIGQNSATHFWCHNCDGKGIAAMRRSHYGVVSYADAEAGAEPIELDWGVYLAPNSKVAEQMARADTDFVDSPRMKVALARCEHGVCVGCEGYGGCLREHGLG